MEGTQAALLVVVEGVGTVHQEVMAVAIMEAVEGQQGVEEVGAEEETFSLMAALAEAQGGELPQQEEMEGSVWCF